MPVQDDVLLLGSDWQGVESALEPTGEDQIFPLRPAVCASTEAFLPCYVMEDGAFPVLGFQMLVARQPQCVVDKAGRRHFSGPLSLFSTRKKIKLATTFPYFQPWHLSKSHCHDSGNRYFPDEPELTNELRNIGLKYWS